MRTMTSTAAAILVLASCAGAPGGGGEEIDLMPGKDLRGWRRVPIKPLAAKPVWTMIEDGKVLRVDGVGAVEMLLCEREFGDGVLRVEWRFRKHEDPKAAYNGGVYVRTVLDGKSWVQAQVARAEKSPVVGDLMGMIPGSEQRQDHFQKGPSPERPLEEWNAYEVTCKGGRISLSVNGVPTAVWEGCPLLRGHVGIQAEFAVLEVRRISWRPD
jgi:hypothetical protein